MSKAGYAEERRRALGEGRGRPQDADQHGRLPKPDSADRPAATSAMRASMRQRRLIRSGTPSSYPATAPMMILVHCGSLSEPSEPSRICTASSYAPKGTPCPNVIGCSRYRSPEMDGILEQMEANGRR